MGIMIEKAPKQFFWDCWNHRH